ncbi:hypothetical protein TW65_00570 [Stemphylium lycopersici]|nr:hypothetical protein TW65_00570 [Stemphylium lycopersici]
MPNLYRDLTGRLLLPISAVMQNPPQRNRPGQGRGQKQDVYDTDAESLDTTVDQSIVQVEESQQRDFQPQLPGQYHNLGVDEDDEDDEEDGESGSEEPEVLYDRENRRFTQEGDRYFEEKDLSYLTHDERLSFLSQAGQTGFQPVDGDSYPTTTNGEPSEVEGGQEPPSDYRYNGGQVSPSPQRPKIKYEGAQQHAAQPTQRQQKIHMPAPKQGTRGSAAIFHHGAQLRDQGRAIPPVVQHTGTGQGFQHHIIAPESSQPPSYSQANTGVSTAHAIHPNRQQAAYGQANNQQHVPRQHSGPSRVQFQSNNTKPLEAPAPLKRPFSVHAIPEQVIHQLPIESAPIDMPEARPQEDYDPETLFKMNYESLMRESFDTDPRSRNPVLAEEDLQRPLVERIELVQKHLDDTNQAEFFRSLPTNEWEDAGDWFLDRFQDIIGRMRQARLKKRKLAQEFEDEVEKRHRHVSKKQHQVEEAMDKMKAQALRFQRLNYYVDVTNQRMLRFAAECVDDRITEGVEQRCVDRHFDILFKRATSDRQNQSIVLNLDDWFEMESATDYPVHFSLHYCLKLASTPTAPRANGCCVYQRPSRGHLLTQRDFFVPGSHMAVVEWKPKSWCIPTESQLEPMESLLVNPKDVTCFLERNHHKRISWKFSACAVAIDALQRLPHRVFNNLSSIVLHEESPSVCAPETHTRGLAFLKEEPLQLCIERRVMGYGAAHFSRWAPVTGSRFLRRHGDQALWFFEAVFAWLQEVQKSREMKALHRGAYSLTFEDDNDKAIWAGLVIPMRMQIDMQENFCIRNITRPPLSTDRGCIYMTFLLPWHFPIGSRN